jgi:hypothetical protein
MARMIPQPMRPDIQSAAERRLYNEFQVQLLDDFSVFHSVWWQLRDAVTGIHDGEADFIIAHPEYGILLLEVKGGRIRYDGQTGEWFSNEHAIKDPFKQGRAAKYSLLEKLKELPYWRNRWITVGHAVAFPDVAVKQDLRLDASREMILDAYDMASLTTWVNQAFRYLRECDSDDNQLGAVGVRELTDLLSPSWDLRPLLSAAVVEERQELVRLTEEQFAMLDFLGRHRRVAISGCAGSGKTTLAVEKASRLARQGFRVLLTCFNVNLARFLSGDKTLPRGLQIVNVHKLATDLCRQAGLADHARRDDRYFDEVLPEQMMEAVDRLGTKLDAIVVDEGQDLSDNWWVPLQCLLGDPDHGIFYVFFDDNQNLYRAAQSIPLELAPFPLTRNCRNTQRIHETVMKFYRSDQKPLGQGPVGRPVEIHTYDDMGSLKRTLSQVLHRLVVEEGMLTEDIVILTPRSRELSSLWRLGTVGNFRLTDQWTTASGEVFGSTIHSFKGLESPVVILAEIEPYVARDLEAVLYVGCSRACHHLIILAATDLPQSLRQRLGAL